MPQVSHALVGGIVTAETRIVEVVSEETVIAVAENVLMVNVEGFLAFSFKRRTQNVQNT